MSFNEVAKSPLLYGLFALVAVLFYPAVYRKEFARGIDYFNHWNHLSIS